MEIKNDCFEKQNILTNRNIAFNTKKRVLRDYVISVLPYDSKYWTNSLELKTMFYSRETKKKVLNNIGPPMCQ